MNTYISEDKKTTKFIHTDGSETSIKVSLSGQYQQSDLNTPVFTDKNKYSIVISSSVGCQMSCKFCHLTHKKACFKEIKTNELINNLKEAILFQYSQTPEIATKHLKLCWMGMGEAILKPSMIRDVSISIIDWALQNNLAIGVDGVDISSVFPKISSKWVGFIEKLNTELNDKYSKKRNPANSKNRSLLRVFYSLHSSKEKVRSILIPNTQSIEKTIYQLKEVNRFGIDIVLHYMFFDKINDSKDDISHLKQFLYNNELNNFEFRILRFNPFNDQIQESINLKDTIKELKECEQQVKIQHSSGETVASSCGQFIAESNNLSEIASELDDVTCLKIQHSSGETVASSCGQFIAESNNLSEIASELEDVTCLKIQHSSGETVASSCGQFIAESKQLS